ncbi:uncharacterized protein LOC127129774 [Lathyrus oleraceus]|uniref:uncharacterized protein LOC127129774 n=1 Tax=Pisum sativum TaxID=3888 RepID=UPI0021CEF131|nr:uncharacterized protein LOC127129774 [Pisum sativum]
MEMLTAFQVNIPFCDALEQMFVYPKFMKELLNGKRKLMDDENFTLVEECSAIIQRKLPLNLIDPGRFTISISIGSVNFCKALGDLGANINLMSLSMMKKLNCGELKPKKMTFTIVDRSITYPYGVLEDVLVKVDNYLFPTDFIILDMPKDTETPLLLGRPFLATSRALIDVERGELIIQFNKEQEIFNVFEAMKHAQEDLQCYQIDLIDKLIKNVSKEEGPSSPTEKILV